MGERKVLNKYYPPDYNPAKIPRKKTCETKQNIVRNMVPMKIRCNKCGNYIGEGTKFNQRKEEVVGERYLGVIKIFRFYFKCSRCCSEMTLLTDPKNADYVVESGGKRCFERRGEDEEVEEVRDYMECLEKRSLESKREMDEVAALHELKSMNSRRSKISVDILIDNLRPKGEEKEEEAIIEATFRGGTREFVRRIDDEDDWDEFPVGELSSKNLKKRKVVSGKSTGNPTDLLSEGCIVGSSKSKGTSGGTVISRSVMATISAVKKKTLNRQEGTEKKTILKDNNSQQESGNAIQCLCAEYGSDEDT